MSTHADHHVFISYARRDGADLAQRLQKDLAGKGFEAWLDTDRISAGATWTKEIEHAIDRSQVVLALLTHGSYVSDICRAEQLRSLRKGKLVIPVLAQTGTDIPLHLEAKNYRDFTVAEKYDSQFLLLVDDIGTGKGAVPLLEKFRTTYVTAPPLPRNYIERTEALVKLRDVLISDDPGPSIALTALHGMGGIGKTILALALSHDDIVQNAFVDGVIWSTAGKEPTYDLITRMQEVRRALGDKPADKESQLECINRYRALMRDKAVLVIVDDVWRVADIEPFLAKSPRSRLLFTTRDASISGSVGAEEHTADLLTDEQSRALLARWSGTEVANLPAIANDLIRECGRLPLAISMIGAMLRSKPLAMWTRIHGLLRHADLERIKAQFPDYPYTDVLRAIQVSVDSLDATARERYIALAVLPEDMPAAVPLQQCLWGVAEGEAAETKEQLVSLSLAQRDQPEGSIRLHDLQLDYVRKQYPTREALPLLQDAIRLSTNVIGRDPNQFASQVIGRLLSYREMPAIERFSAKVVEGPRIPWLRPMQPTLHPPGTSLIRTLEGHTDYVFAVAITRDGRMALSASRDKTLKMWDVAGGRVLRTLKGHTKAVNGVSLSADGRQAISASADETLKVWDLDSGRDAHTLTGHSDSVTCVVMSGDGRMAVSASADKTLKIWDVQSGREIHTLKGHTKAVNSVGLTTDDRCAISASSDKTLKVWDVESGSEVCTLNGHSAWVHWVTVSGDGRLAISASKDKTLKVWDVENGLELRTLKDHTRPVYCVAVSGDGTRAVSASADHTLKVWDGESGLELRILKGHTRAVYGVALTGDGRLAVSASRDKTLKLWDLESRCELSPLPSHSRRVLGLAVSGDGTRAVSASADHTLKVWDGESGLELLTIKGHSYALRGVAVSGNGQRAVSASSDKTLVVWDVGSGRKLRTLEGHSHVVYGVAVSEDGRLAVSASSDKTLKVWDVESGRELHALEGHSHAVRGVAVSEDGRLAVSASSDKTLKVWDVESGRELRTLSGHSSFVNGVAVTRDGRRAISASWDHTLKVWDVDSGRELRTLKGHVGWVYGVALTRDGRRAVSASYDKTLKVWDVETGVSLATFSCDSAACCCVFINDRDVIAGDAGGCVHFLRLEEPKLRN